MPHVHKLRKSLRRNVEGLPDAGGGMGYAIGKSQTFVEIMQRWVGGTGAAGSLEADTYATYATAQGSFAGYVVEKSIEARFDLKFEGAGPIWEENVKLLIP